MTLDDVAGALIVLAFADWALTSVLLLSAHYFPNAALTERAVVGIICSTIATIFAVLGAVRLQIIELPPGTPLILLAIGALLVSAPQFVWGFGLVMGKFR